MIYDVDGNVLTKVVQSALSRPDLIEIKNRTLDGKYHVQSIGSGGTVVDVKAYLTMDEKLVFDNKKRNSNYIVVVFDGWSYSGPIDGELSYERIASFGNKPMFAVSFSLLVEFEEEM